jgi:hypothetical protein
MTVSSISAAGLSQFVLASSESDRLHQAFQSLQKSLASNDLSGAQWVFQTVQTLYQDSLVASGSSSISSQLASDLAAVGSALNSGDLSTAQSAFATVLSDLKNTALPSQTTEANAASQSVQLVNELLDTLNPSAVSSSPTDISSSILHSVYNGGLNVRG